MVGLIDTDVIDPSADLEIILNIDQQSTKQNGYYELEDGIREEFLHGVHNFNYGTYFDPILSGKFDIKITYCCSNNSYAIQASDLVAGTVRRDLLNNRKDILDDLDVKLLLP
jgi:hypothetical protein